MNITIQGTPVQRFTQMAGGLKSTQQKLERQEKCASQVAFFEKQKDQLKNMECTGLDEIAKKLDMLHTYEDQIAAAKKAYNDSQMMSVLDEARERGEKIAKAAEKTAPKTEEERRKEQVEEAAGSEENKGMLSEMMEEISEMTEENIETLEEEADLAEETLKEEADPVQETMEEKIELMQKQKEFPQENANPVQEPSAATGQTKNLQGITKFQENTIEKLRYQHIDYMV